MSAFDFFKNVNSTFLQFTGDGRAYIDYNFGGGAFTRGSAAPGLINLGSTNIEVVAFDGVNTLEELSRELELNHDWAEGTVVYPHIHWYPVNGNVGNVRWQLEYVLVAPDAAVVPASTTIGVTQAAGGTGWAPRFGSFPTIDGSGFTIGTQMHIRLFRDPTDPADTYGSDAALATFGLHVLLDSIGSRELTSK